ncbi:PRC-barrel domain containing protein [Agrobacterium rubi]|nr:PRC-barrel domain containing protein [Agrobacterium rubi]NTF24968.1 PRC-barrel domain containing protein [Agrobacterium rubi]
MKTFAIVPAAALSLSLAASAAFAQQAVAPSHQPVATATEIAVALAPSGLLVGEKPAVTVKYISVQPADVVTSNIVGAPIYNSNDEKLGEVADLVLTEGDMLTGVVASVGGFLGIGESYVVIDPSTVMVNQKDGKWVAYVNTTKDALSAAPKFEYPSKSG